MSLNKFTNSDTGVELGLKIGCVELKSSLLDNQGHGWVVNDDASGGAVAMPNFNSYVEPNTPIQNRKLPPSLFTEHPQGITIEKDGYYNVVGMVRIVRSTADQTNYCQILVNGAYSQQRPASTSPSTGVNADMWFNVSDVVYLTAGQRISVGVAGTAGGTATFQSWRIDATYLSSQLP